MTPRLIILLLLSAFGLCGCSAVKVTNGIPNLKVVDAGFYRSGQPDAAGFDWLLEHEHDYHGRFTVLKLDTNDEGPADAVHSSNGFEVVHGCNIIYFPISTVKTCSA